MTDHVSQYPKLGRSPLRNAATSPASSASDEKYLALQWSVKTVAGSPKYLIHFAAILLTLTTALLGLYIWIAWDMFMEERGFLAFIILSQYGVSCLFIAATRQTRIYKYKIFNTHARLVYTPYYSTYVKTAFKTAIFIIVFLLLLAGLMTNFLLFIIGPGGGLLILACVILNWTFPITRDRSVPWHLYNYVTVDRKRRFIVTHITDQTLGFEARLPNDELFEEYLAFLRSVLPADAQYTEKKWNLSTI